MQPLRRLNPAADPPPTQLPSQQALLWWALLAMAPPVPRTQASPAADKTPHLPSASSPLSPPKEPPTRLGAAPPTLRTPPTPAAPLPPPSSPGGQRTATKIRSPAAISLHLRPPRPPLQPSPPPRQPPPPPPLLPPRCPHPLRRPRLPHPLIFVVQTQTTQHIMKAGIATNAMLPTHPAGQLGRSPQGHLLLKMQLSASHLPTPPTCPRSPAALLTRTTGLLPRKLHPQSLQNLVEVAGAGGPAPREKKLGPPPGQPHPPALAPQPQRPPMRACPSLSTAAWILALRCC